MNLIQKSMATVISVGMAVTMLSGCGASEGKRIIRVGHVQAMDHPVHISMRAFEDYVEERLGDRYDVEVYPSELLGSATNMVQLCQTGGIDFCVASNAILEAFSENYTLFNLPYLFASEEAYHASMDDPEIMEPIFESTRPAGFESVTWIDSGSRSFYTVDTPIEKPEDLKGLKIRVQPSATSVEMMRLLGGSATPMGFGDVYTALQANVIDGSETNELALTSNGHGEVCKYYCYDMHQMISDLLIGNCDFLDSLAPEERKVFDEAFKVANRVEREEWEKAVEEAVERATNEMGVTFIHPDKTPFREICEPMHEELLQKNPDLRPIYEKIQEHNAQAPNDN